jgi:hypothetical protein
LFSPIAGMMMQSDELIFSEGFKPPTSLRCLCVYIICVFSAVSRFSLYVSSEHARGTCFQRCVGQDASNVFGRTDDVPILWRYHMLTVDADG